MTDQEMEILQGTISAVVYQNYENGYSVLRLNVGGGENVTVVGTIPLPVVGEQLMVTGRWSTHSNYGKQFEAEFLDPTLASVFANGSIEFHISAFVFVCAPTSISVERGSMCRLNRYALR